MKSVLLLVTLVLPGSVLAQDVNLDTFVRAESDHMIRANMKMMGAEVGSFVHLREPVSPDNQPVIRMNQDTLYSGTVIDVSEPVQITLPEIGGRYQSMHVVNQDHFMFVKTLPGTYNLTKEEVGTQFALVTIRTFVDVNNPEDIAEAHAAQDAISMAGGGAGPFEAPDWNLERLAVIRKSLNDIAALGFETSNAFGTQEETRPIDHLVGAASGWGGLPASAAYYVLDSVPANDGQTPHKVTLHYVPVRAFWSVTVYNSNGYLEANELNRNSYNNVTAAQNDDGSTTLHFGSCEDGRINCIPITPGWNYAVRLYEPEPEVLNGDWAFPPIVPAS